VIRGSINNKDYAIGVAMLLVVICMWTASSFIAQDMFEGGYNKPFLLTYVNTSSFSLYLIPFFVRRIWYQYRGSGGSNTGAGEYQPLVGVDMVDNTQISLPNEPPPLTVRETAKLASIFCYIWFIANWSVNASLEYTSVSSATILSSMSGFFTLGVGRLFRVETLSMGKIVAVFTSFIGVVLISLSDSNKPISPLFARLAENIPVDASRRLLGDGLALISSMFYAIYVILLKVRIGDESRVDMTLFFGFVGLVNILSCWPVGIVLHLVGLEKFELPSTQKQMIALVINTIITLTSDYLYVMAMLRTTPLVVTVGISLTIPLAVLGDYFLGKPSQGQVILGALLVLFSFVTIGVKNAKKQETDVIVYSNVAGED